MQSYLPDTLPKNARYWFLTGVWALALSGLFSITLVVARTPGLADTPFFKSLFHQALVAHVDLSVLAWFLAIIAMVLAMVCQEKKITIPYLSPAALLSFNVGLLAITIAPFTGDGEALMVNYIPVISNPLFFTGLALLLTGILLAMADAMFAARFTNFSPVRLGAYSMIDILLIALLCFYLSSLDLDAISGEQYYEMLFWGGGHVLQFAYVQLLLIAWLLIATHLNFTLPTNPGQYGLFMLGYSVALFAPLIYVFHDASSYEYQQAFTLKMGWALGVAPGLFGAWLFYQLLITKHKLATRALRAALWMSLILFFVGGVFALMIDGQNVKIPAHYHGSIVGITLALMGFAYLMLPKFGYADVTSWRMAYYQPIFIGMGQLMHISGLAYSGGYGVLRKTPGEVEGGVTAVKIALGFMGFGGLLAIIGGLLFVIVIIRAIRNRNESQA
jgi:hypothetical protein